jgi:hypothetical protein
MRVLALTSAILLAGQASTATDTPAARASGDWRLSEVGGRVACTLTFTRQTSLAGSFELRAPLACRRAFPPLKAVAAWALDDKGAIVLTDANAQTIVTFAPPAKGPYETKAPDGRTWRLEPIHTDSEAPMVTAPPYG